MPGSTIFHAAIFVAGAALGATAVTVANSRKHRFDSIPKPSKSSHTNGGIGNRYGNGVMVEMGPKGVATLVQQPFRGDVLKYGHPGPISDFIERKVYTMGYDRRLRHPAWTAEHLTLAGFSPPPDGPGGGDRSKSVFKEDESIPLPFRALLKDYYRSGYDRGHMVPAADAKVSQEAMDETFFLSNMCPQVGDGFNRHYWAYVENWCRKLTSSYADVFVFTVPLYLPKLEADGKSRVTYEVIGSPANVAVPTHFAKVVLGSKPTSASTPDISELSTGAFVFPNASIPDQKKLTEFIVPVEAVEKATGLIFFPEDIKKGSKHICQTTSCDLVVRRFDDANKNVKRIEGSKQ